MYYTIIYNLYNMHKRSIVHNESSLFFTDFCNNFETIKLTNYLFHYYIISFNQNLSKQILYIKKYMNI